MKDIPEIETGLLSTRRARALESRDRVTSLNCLSQMKAVLARRFGWSTDDDSSSDEDVFIRGVDGVVTGGHPAAVTGTTDGRATEGVPPENSDQLVRDFLNDPATVLQRDSYGLEVAGTFVDTSFKSTPQLEQGKPGGPDYFNCKQLKNATVRLFAKHQRYKGVRELKVVPADKEDAARVQFLPWLQSKLTYCKLEPNTLLALTGPMNGCSVYVVVVTGRGEADGTYLFHVNANASDLQGAEAARRHKETLKAAVASMWGGAATITRGVTNVQYGATGVDAGAECLVYGTNGSAGWEFFYYAIEIDRDNTWRKKNSMPAVLPTPEL
jgi:hypothetical protein